MADPARVEMTAMVAGAPAVGARYENGGRVYVFLDEWATLDAQLSSTNTARFWRNVLNYVLP